MTQTHLEIRVHPGQRDTAVAAFKERRVFEECSAAIAGFLGAELLVSPDDPDVLWVVAHWQNRESAKAWMTSPVREAQNQDLSRYASEPPVSRLLEQAGYAHSPQNNRSLRSDKAKKGPNT